jgi:hypothetical protein
VIGLLGQVMRPAWDAGRVERRTRIPTGFS